jgi:Fe-S-cluster-containing dehydrogenase component
MKGQFWMNLSELERGQYPKVKVTYTPLTCMHCKDANCMKHASDGAVYRRPDGIVIIDPVKAKGQKQLVEACPYRVIYWNEEKQLPQKCTMCAHLLDRGWKEPRCVELCPSGALTFGDLDDPESAVAKLAADGQAVSLHPEFEAKENVLYINLPGKFIAGTVAYADTDEVAKNAAVLIKAKGFQKSLKTDNFGDFEFEGLQDNTDYKLTIEAAGYRPQEMTIRTRMDINVGVIMLEKQN